jgi:hypothetical protein
MTTDEKDPLTHHGACGKGWKQRGNRTGHCAACHETFEGLSVFAAHRRQNEDGTAICLQPAAVTYQKKPLRLIEGTWRGPELPKNTFSTTKESN